MCYGYPNHETWLASVYLSGGFDNKKAPKEWAEQTNYLIKQYKDKAFKLLCFALKDHFLYGSPLSDGFFAQVLEHAIYQIDFDYLTVDLIQVWAEKKYRVA